MEEKLPWEIKWEEEDMSRRSDIHRAVQKICNQVFCGTGKNPDSWVVGSKVADFVFRNGLLVERYNPTWVPAVLHPEEREKFIREIEDIILYFMNGFEEEEEKRHQCAIAITNWLELNGLLARYLPQGENNYIW